MNTTSVGEFLKTKRETLGYSLDRMAEETNISHQFLEGLETDDFHAFPAEAFITGFIRSYAEYLELDPREALSLYENRAHKDRLPAVEGDETTRGGIGEAAGQDSLTDTGTRDPKLHGHRESVPGMQHRTAEGSRAAGNQDSVPVRQEGNRQNARGKAQHPGENPDTPGPVKVRGRFMLVGITALILVIAAGIAIIQYRNSIHSDKDNAATGPSEYRIEETAFEKRLYPGDSLLVTHRGDTYKIRLKDISNTVDFETPQGSLSVLLGEETLLDFDKDMQSDLKLAVTDFSRKSPGSGALLRFEKITTAEGTAEDSGIPADMSVSDIQNADITDRKSGTLFRAARGPYPFVVTVTFRTGSLFRHEADRREWKEQYYAKGETITINAESSLMVWSANAQAARVTITASGGKTADLELGGPGEIAVKRRGWTQTEGSWVMSAVDQD